VAPKATVTVPELAVVDALVDEVNDANVPSPATLAAEATAASDTRTFDVRDNFFTTTPSVWTSNWTNNDQFGPQLELR
jgi:hypothetical protein